MTLFFLLYADRVPYYVHPDKAVTEKPDAACRIGFKLWAYSVMRVVSVNTASNSSCGTDKDRGNPVAGSHTKV